MSYKYLVIAALTSMATAACASVPQNQGKAETATTPAATCEIKPDRKVASCAALPALDEVDKSATPETPSRRSREVFHSGGRLGS